MKMKKSVSFLSPNRAQKEKKEIRAVQFQSTIHRYESALNKKCDME